MGLGAYCSSKCKTKLVKDAKDHERELLDEALDVMPEEFDVPAFDRFMLKLALHMIRDLPPHVREKWRKNNPLMLSAWDLSLELKERAIRHIPLFYVSSMNAEGHNRMFYSGTFMFKAKVPKKVLWDALVAAKIMKAKGE
jgi:hypothetical protein